MTVETLIRPVVEMPADLPERNVDAEDVGVPTESDESGGLGRLLVVWVAATTIGLFGAVALAVWSVTGSVANGVLGGLFTTMWGGPGFGVMFGAAYHSIKEENATKRSGQE